MKLPKDLEKRVRQTIWQKSKTCVLWFTGLLLLIIFFGDVVFPTKYVGMKIVGYILVLALPFIFTKFPFNLIDETYCGTIEHVEIKTSTVNEFLATRFREGGATYAYKINTLYLHIITPEGECIRRKVFSGQTDQGQFWIHTTRAIKFFTFTARKLLCFCPQRRTSTLPAPFAAR